MHKYSFLEKHQIQQMRKQMNVMLLPTQPTSQYLNIFKYVDNHVIFHLIVFQFRQESDGLLISSKSHGFRTGLIMDQLDLLDEGD